MFRLTTAFFCAFAFVLCLAPTAGAQSGPQMLTDDPGTPGNGNFELNLAGTFEGTGRQRLWHLPEFDLNYGVGPNLQLNLQTAAVVLNRRGHGPVGGLGATSAAIKWRFLDQEKTGVSVSIFPRIERAISSSSVRRGLAEDGTRFFLPLEAARSFGPINLDIEVAALLSTVGRAEWSYGLLGGTAITTNLDLMAELHGSGRANFFADRLTVNFGLRQKIDRSTALVASLGHDLRTPESEPLALVSYCGLQWEF